MPTQGEATERDLVTEVEELLTKATPGPWRLQPKDYIIGDERDDEAVIVGHVEFGDTPEERTAGEHNLNLIIRARNDLLYRLAEEVKANRETLLALHNCQNKPVCGHCNNLLRHATRKLDHA